MLDEYWSALQQALRFAAEAVDDLHRQIFLAVARQYLFVISIIEGREITLEEVLRNLGESDRRVSMRH